ncbi:fused MFS/spermidine synthase [Shewanella sp. SHSM-M6]|uniref:Fused MFS/spermidine synthase n=2 Tax=Shewanella salipaludis TaxID=2723052 RepID=A0A972JMH5_9GAMM|nr:fused MFS/spermidine synthase [Shewanella salipaludis]
MNRILFIIVIFFSAFLLFQIQPILSKELLPVFGGGASIWTASLCFYQSALLLGYFYAHGLGYLKLKSQATIHFMLLAIAIGTTFYQPECVMGETLSPAARVILNLTLQVGSIFVLLSSTSILLQRWYCDVFVKEVPYHWYAWSNVGSLLALLSYPFVFEINFSLSEQKLGWLSAATIMVVALALLMSNLIRHANNTGSESTGNALSHHPFMSRCALLWIALAACSTLCLIATTQMVSTNIPPMPLLWVLPLALYLVTFIIAFALPKQGVHFIWLGPLVFAWLAGVMMYFIGGQFNALAQLAMYSLILAICCLFCHSQLRALAPTKSQMTHFYICIALGGALGSVFSALVAPLIFEQLLEYPLMLLMTLGLFTLRFDKPLAMNKAKGLAIAMVLSCTSLFAWLNGQFNQFNVATDRNFYGYIAVKDVKTAAINERRLIDGTTVHGSETLQGVRHLTRDYYHADTGVGRALEILKQFGPLNIGVIGLGAGVMAHFGDEHDRFTFYELNPAVYQMATIYFSYLKHARAQVDVTLADGRLALREEANSQLPTKNALIIDAFSSDVIPTHLMTLEAFQLYWRRLQDTGVLIVHISSNYVDLMPVLSAHALSLNKSLLVFDYQGNDITHLGSKWAVMTSDPRFLAAFPANSHRTINPESTDKLVFWTDEKNSVLPLLKF